MKYREHVKGQGGWVVRDYPDVLSDAQWLWYVANFRVTDPQQYQDAPYESFVEEDIFSHLDASVVAALQNKIASCPVTEKNTATAEEKEYLKFKKDDRDVVSNIKWFDVNEEHEIKTIIPKENV